MLARAEALFLFPVKACAGLAVDRLVFNEHGRIEGDREWVVTDAAGRVTWQGDHPSLALVQPAFEGPDLVLHAPGAAPLRLGPQAPRQEVGIGIWNETDQRHERFTAHDAGPPARDFLRVLTGVELRLMRLGQAALARRGLNPVHLLSRDSLHELDEALRLRGHAPAAVARFRPNIVLGGEGLLPFIEDHLTLLRWADGELQATTPCVRCVVPNVDPATGEMGAQPAPTVAELSTQRRPGQPSTLGIYARPVRAGMLARGSAMRLELSL